MLMEPPMFEEPSGASSLVGSPSSSGASLGGGWPWLSGEMVK